MTPCEQHSGVVADIKNIKDDVRDIKTGQREILEKLGTMSGKQPPSIAVMLIISFLSTLCVALLVFFVTKAIFTGKAAHIAQYLCERIYS